MRWWLSFCDTDRPRGEQFLGVCIVEAADEITAVKASWAMGLNPGGEVAFMSIDEATASRLSFELPFEVFVPRNEATLLSQRIDKELLS